MVRCLNVRARVPCCVGVSGASGVLCIIVLLNLLVINSLGLLGRTLLGKSGVIVKQKVL